MKFHHKKLVDGFLSICQNFINLVIKEIINEKTEAKIQWFPKDLVLKVLYKEDMDVYLKYAIETYGIDFWKLLTDGKKHEKIINRL